MSNEDYKRRMNIASRYSAVVLWLQDISMDSALVPIYPESCVVDEGTNEFLVRAHEYILNRDETFRTQHGRIQSRERVVRTSIAPPGFSGEQWEAHSWIYGWHTEDGEYR